MASPPGSVLSLQISGPRPLGGESSSDRRATILRTGTVTVIGSSDRSTLATIQQDWLRFCWSRSALQSCPLPAHTSSGFPGTLTDRVKSKTSSFAFSHSARLIHQRRALRYL